MKWDRNIMREPAVIGAYCDSNFSGIEVLDPAVHDYEDTYADGILKVVDYYEGMTGPHYGRVCTCKIHWSTRDYIVHNGRRIHMDEILRW